MSNHDRDKFRSYPSGCQKRLKKQKNDEFIKKQQGSIFKFIQVSQPTTSSEKHIDPKEKSLTAEAPMIFNNSDETSQLRNETNLVKVDGGKENVFDEYEPISHRSEPVNSIDLDPLVDLRDVGNWPDIINSKVRVDIVKLGPYRKKCVKYPMSIVDKTERQFSNTYYSRKLPNGEYINRQWLIYSTLKDRVYCFSCKLFPSHEENIRISSLATIGINDWKHLSERLKSHEISGTHITSLRD